MTTQAYHNPTSTPTEDSRLAARAHRVYSAAIARNALRDCLAGADVQTLAIVEDAADQADLRAIAHEIIRERCGRKWVSQSDDAILRAVRS